jgi:succinyl-diaminopimelate desuccinylase
VAADFAAAIGGEPRAKFGWTDVARFSALGIPAVNYGPGDPGVAHSADEHVKVVQLRDVERKMREWLS